MKYLALLSSFIFFPGLLVAQSLRSTFVGTLSIKGGDSYSYKLQLTDSNGVLSGYSVTDVMGPNETKTAVKGTINAEKRQIDFHETRILSTKAKSAPGDYCCYVRGHLKVGKLQGTQTLKGSFTGYQEDGKTECATGKLAMVCMQDILEKMLKAREKAAPATASKDTLEAQPKPTATIVYEKEIPESEIKKVLPGASIVFDCPSTSVSVELWDFRTIDGDRITLLQDGDKILEDYTLSATHKTVNINIGNSKSSMLELIAQNEGSEPLNTARIRIASGAREYYLDASTTMDKSVKIVLARKDQ
jgi:hypothetical protein